MYFMKILVAVGCPLPEDLLYYTANDFDTTQGRVTSSFCLTLSCIARLCIVWLNGCLIALILDNMSGWKRQDRCMYMATIHVTLISRETSLNSLVNEADSIFPCLNFFTGTLARFIAMVQTYIGSLNPLSC